MDNDNPHQILNTHQSIKKIIIISLVVAIFSGTGGFLIGVNYVKKTISASPIKIKNLQSKTKIFAAPSDIYKVAYVKFGNIWIINSDGTGLKRITDYGLNFHPVLSSNGKYVAFYSIDQKLKSTLNQDSGQFGTGINIWVIKTDGTHAVQLTDSDLKATRSALSWSPDGSTIMYNDDGKIITVLADGSMKKTIIDLSTLSKPYVNDKDAIVLDTPEWSQDGTQIAVQAYTRLPQGEGDNGETSILLFDLQGNIIDQYANSNLGIFLSKNNTIYQIDSATIGIYGLWSKNIDGSGIKLISGGIDSIPQSMQVKKLEKSAIYRSDMLNFSNDGTLISFVKTPSGQTVSEDTIWTMLANGTNAHPIIKIPSSMKQMKNCSELSVWEIQWAPDDNHLVVTLRGSSGKGNFGNCTGIYTLDTRTRMLQTLVPLYLGTNFTSQQPLDLMDSEFSI